MPNTLRHYLVHKEKGGKLLFKVLLVHAGLSVGVSLFFLLVAIMLGATEIVLLAIPFCLLSLIYFRYAGWQLYGFYRFWIQNDTLFCKRKCYYGLNQVIEIRLREVDILEIQNKTKHVKLHFIFTENALLVQRNINLSYVSTDNEVLQVLM